MPSEDVRARGLDFGSFSSGQVADPLELESKGNSWLNEKQVDDGENGNELIELSDSELDFKPDHVTATEASDWKHSNELMTFGDEFSLLI